MESPISIEIGLLKAQVRLSVIFGSPHWLMETVFRETFQLPSRLPKPPKPRPTYRNPIFRAKEYARMIESGLAKNESDLARKIGASRVRVCQYVRLLSLDASVIKALEQLGDPLTERVITERRLRPYLRKTPKEQKQIIDVIKRYEGKTQVISA